MQLISKSIIRLIKKQITQHIDQNNYGDKLLLTMPEFPIVIVNEIANEVEKFCIYEPKMSKPIIKVAQNLFEEWNHSNCPEMKNRCQEIVNNHWNDTHENLTFYRNTSPHEPSKILFILLIGINRITDASSLSDFHCCDLRTIWEEELLFSFKKWTKKIFENSAIGFEKNHIEHFDEVLKTLIGKGIADILQISDLLDNLYLSVAQDGGTAEKILLKNLNCFELPSLVGYKFSNKQLLGSYIDDAKDFFNYVSFLEESVRKNAIEKITAFKNDKDLDEFSDKDIIGIYKDAHDFIDGLERYVKKDNRKDRNKLLKCDFVFIRDTILKYKPKKTETVSTKPPDSPSTIKVLTGNPIEVVLSALWYAIAEFKKIAIKRGFLAHENIKHILIRSEVFKHDQEDKSPDQKKDKAITYLRRLIGGIDRCIKDHLNISSLLADDQDLQIDSELFNNEINYSASGNAEPHLKFFITIASYHADIKVNKFFKWRLPETDPYRVADLLITWAAKGVDSAQGFCLPVFHVPYYEELMLAKDEDETNRILLHCIHQDDENIFNMLNVKDIESSDPLFKRTEKLSYSYDQFLQNAVDRGLHSALFSDAWISLRKNFENAFKEYISNKECSKSPIANLLYRAFLIINKRIHSEDTWVWEPSEASGVVTILHPALLEIYHAQIIFQLTSFVAIAKKELRAPGSKTFKDSVWQNYIDLSFIKMPLSGLFKNRNKILETNLRGINFVHRIGEIGEKEVSLTTRMLLSYDAFEDEDITDAELFRKSRESMLIYHILTDYQQIHPHAKDSLSLAIYQNQNFQPLISALDQFLKELANSRDNSLPKFAMKIIFYTDSTDDTHITQWFNQWKDRFESAESQQKFSHYQNIVLSISNRIVSAEDNYQQFIRIIHDDLQVDLAILSTFIKGVEEGDDFADVEPYDVTSRTLKFPILEKSFCAIVAPGYLLQRLRVFSNRQFRLTTMHGELMARIKNPLTPTDRQHVILGYRNYEPWKGVIDTLHKCAEWVVCIDPSIDTRLVTHDNQNREIIGFGSGVGSHGESNYTISTEQFKLNDIRKRIEVLMQERFTGWTGDNYEKAATAIIKESPRLSGLSLIRATGSSNYIHDFIAYSITRKLLKSKNNIICDHLISLDAYRHWFYSAENETRPDLLWLSASIDNNKRIVIDARLIECKLALFADTYLNKAREQLENGLNHLVSVFKPEIDNKSTQEEAPDQRYWWLQLHRLIASKAEIHIHEKEHVLTALEKLTEGDFDICWRANAVTFWLDQTNSDISFDLKWHMTVESQQIDIGIFSAGSSFICNLCTDNLDIEMPWHNQNIICFKAGKTQKNINHVIEKNQVNINNTFTEEHIIKLGLEDKKLNRVLLGQTTNGAKKVYWEFGHQDLNNRHMLIFGTSGMGKTYTIQCLLYELGLLRQNSLIVDYSNGFFDNQLENELIDKLKPLQHLVRRTPLSVNPFRRQVDIFGNEKIPEDPGNTAQRISGVFSEVYRLGDQQKSALYAAIKQGLENEQISDMTLSELIPQLERISKNKHAKGQAASNIISKIQPFIDQNPFGPEQPDSWDLMFNDPKNRCHIIQLAGFLRDSSRLITEFTLIDLYWFYRGRGLKDKPRVIVLDEVQNLNHKEESPLAQLLREGRKFGFSLILATQIMSDLSRDARDRLFIAAHKLFFRPAETEIRSYAEIASIYTNEKVDVWINKIASLKKTECYSIGPSMNNVTRSLEMKAFKIKIQSLENRSSDERRNR
jgi:DNA phosphorothioation-dependent restriction protein DptH